MASDDDFLFSDDKMAAARREMDHKEWVSEALASAPSDPSSSSLLSSVEEEEVKSQTTAKEKTLSQPQPPEQQQRPPSPAEGPSVLDERPWDEAAVQLEGVPEEKAARVVALAGAVGGVRGRPEPLCDPLTLLRFLDARDGDVDAALAMYRDTIAWRRAFGLAGVMERFGSGATYCDDSADGANDGGGGSRRSGDGGGGGAAGRATPHRAMVGGTATSASPPYYHRMVAGPWLWERRPKKMPADELLAQCCLFFTRLPDKKKRKRAMRRAAGKKQSGGGREHGDEGNNDDDRDDEDDDTDTDNDDDDDFGAPVAVWRLGRCDFGGLGREGLVDDAMRLFVSHMEDLLQAGRAASIRCRKMLRARVVIDAGGLGLSAVHHVKLIKAITSIGKQYFPETTASSTIINAPWMMKGLFSVVAPLLTTVQRKKVCILGSQWAAVPSPAAGSAKKKKGLGGTRTATMSPPLTDLLSSAAAAAPAAADDDDDDNDIDEEPASSAELRLVGCFEAHSGVHPLALPAECLGGGGGPPRPPNIITATATLETSNGRGSSSGTPESTITPPTLKMLCPDLLNPIPARTGALFLQYQASWTATISTSAATTTAMTTASAPL